MTSYFCETSEAAILTKTREKKRTTLAALTTTTKLRSENDNELQSNRRTLRIATIVLLQ